MKKTILTVFIAAIILLMTVAVILLANPFKPLFDSLFFPEESAPEHKVEVNLTAKDEADFSNRYPKAEQLVRDYFTTLRCLEGTLDLDSRGELEGLYAPMEKSYLSDKLRLYSKSVLADNSKSSLFYDSCRVRLSYESVIEVNEGFLIVTLSENTNVYYSCLDGEPCAIGVSEHSFTLVDDRGWKITSHEVSGGDYDYTNDILSELYAADGYALNELTYTYMEPYYKKAQELVAKRAKKNGEILSGSCSVEASEPPFSYDRRLAAEYALKWTVNGKSVRNPLFGDFENDSTNFVSQCLLAGGIPQDCQGDDKFTQWKWYSSEINYKREHSGCSEAWYDSEAFYTYAVSDEGFGLVACELSGVSMLETGDVVRLVMNDNKANSAIVTAISYDDEGAVAEVFVTMHSPDRKNVPLSSIGCKELRLIKILGYNSSNF